MKKQVPLVCQHLEGIHRAALEKYQKIVVNYVKDRQGVYALYRKGRLYYVGLASDLRWRLKHHLKDHHGKAWDSFSVYLTIGDRHLRELESLLLRVVKPRPKGNIQRGKFASSQSLMRRFRSDMKAFYQQDWNKLIGKKVKSRVSNDKHAATELGGYMENRRPFTIKAHYKGKTYKARVRKDGSIRMDGQIFPSPSAAGGVVKNGAACNGWRFWQFERAPGDWVSIHKLRS